MENAERLSVRERMPVPVIIGTAAAATIVCLFIRWGQNGMYWLGPTLPWAYFISSTFVGWILGSPRVLPPRNGGAWRGRMFATAYLAIGLAGAVSLIFDVGVFFPDGVYRNDRLLRMLLEPLIYLAPLLVFLPAALVLVIRDVYKALTVGVFALIVFTVALVVTELSAEYLLLFLKLR